MATPAALLEKINQTQTSSSL
ncbi:hypothetical protein CCACVL1_23495 [Corchorus capsularis]|uniref:Uncharacterized protein n=1 Tax=Corchorus capsularis TaxID=210143 RepID=A0A1R3GTZ2_COCAP|nr:hypothetical protein CCACVL1_23495 [Corchorus capsularis]